MLIRFWLTLSLLLVCGTLTGGCFIRAEDPPLVRREPIGNELTRFVWYKCARCDEWGNALGEDGERLNKSGVGATECSFCGGTGAFTVEELGFMPKREDVQ